MRTSTIQTLAAILLSGATALAGTFTNAFNDPNNTTGTTFGGSGTLPDTSPFNPVIVSNYLVLTTNVNNIAGSVVLDDLDPGSTIESFVVSFNMLLDSGAATPADGVAFVFGNITAGLTWNEEGPTTMNGITLSFDTYDNTGLTPPDDAPAIDIKVNGGVNNYLYHDHVALTNVMSPNFTNVTIILKRNGTLSVSYKGKVVYTNAYLTGFVPASGFLFGIGARTGGLNENAWINDLSVSTTVAGAVVAPTITAQPQNQSVNESGTATFNFGFDGTAPFTFQWYSNAVAIANATNASLILTNVPFSANAALISVGITNSMGGMLSSTATLTINRDTNPPTVLKASADLTFQAIVVTYSKPVSDTALATANYSLDQGATVSTITRINAQSVRLQTSQLAQGQTYNLTINGVQDTATVPNTIAANTKVAIHTFVFLGGTLLHKKYNNVSDGSGWPLSGLFNDPRYPNLPDRFDVEQDWEYPPGGVARITADPTRDYWDTLEGYFFPPVTTNYVFYTCGADRFALWLSTDDNPANKNEITELSGWTNPRAWTQGQPISGGVPTAIPGAESDQFTGSQWPTGSTITLTNGQRYYMLMVHHDPSWSGADDFAATYTFENEPAPNPGDVPKLAGNAVGFYFDPTGASIKFVQQPQNATVAQGKTAVFSASATGSSAYGSNVLYQWQSAPKSSTTFTNIPNGTGNSVTTPILALADSGSQYRVIATLAPLSLTSSVVTVTVSTDTTPPVLTAGAMADSVAGTIDVGVGFNKTVDSSAGVLANYSVAGGTVTSVTVYTNRFTADSQNPLVKVLKQSVLLKVTGLTGNSGVLTANNITDTFGNKLVSTNIPFTVGAMQWGVVGANQLGGTNAVVPVAANGFDVYSDGISEWANYDETTFVYQQVTGDFDKKLRVEYQDGSSEWARAGLIARDVTNFGVDSTTQATSAGRYQKIHVNPVGATLTGPGTLGNHLWEGNRRLTTGGQTTTALTGVNSTPQYPNAWCRLKRVGQTFTIFRSDDGITWVQLGQSTATDWGTATPMPDTLYVGPEFSPENGNVTLTPDKGTFLASFRDYGDFVVGTQPLITISVDNTGKVTLTFSGTLLSSPTVIGTYAAVTNATSPYVVTPSGGATFYRAKQ